MSVGDLSITALYTNGASTRQDFPGARLLACEDADMVFGITNGFLRLATITRRLPNLAASVIQRHAMLDHLLAEELAATRAPRGPFVLEIAAGLSPRGIAFTALPNMEDLDYVEVDLPAVIARKRELLARTLEGQDAALRENLHLIAADVERSDLSTLVEPASQAQPARPLTVIAEGLFMYLDREARRHLWARIAALLADAGGGSSFLFDLVPPAEEPPTGLGGRLLECALKAATGGRTFERDGATRDEILADLDASGFTSVETFEPLQVRQEWNLPGADEHTQMVVYRCRLAQRMSSTP